MNMLVVPRWVAVCLAVSILSAVGYSAYALTSYTIIKPFTLTLTTAATPFDISSVNFAYDPGTNQYPSCTLSIVNSGSQSVTATVYVYLKNATGSTVANGQLTQAFSPGTITVTVTLTWASGKTVADVAGGYIVIQPA